MAAERATIDRLVAAHLSDKIGAQFDARINGLVGAGIFVTLSETGADGFVPVLSLGGDRFIYNEKAHALVGARTGETYTLGDRVEVVLKEVSPVSGGMRFEIVTPGRPGKPAGPPASRAQSRGRRRKPAARRA
jgi:ribonuclease R